MVDEIKDEENKEEEVKDEVVNKEAEEASSTVETAQEEKPLDKMTAPELREIAKAIPGVTGASAMKKAELLAIIKEYRGIEEEKPAKRKKKTPKGASVKELKKKIVSLRAEKSTARDDKNRRKTNTLRRRINRLKKRTRKVVQA